MCVCVSRMRGGFFGGSGKRGGVSRTLCEALVSCNRASSEASAEAVISLRACILCGCPLCETMAGASSSTDVAPSGGLDVPLVAMPDASSSSSVVLAAAAPDMGDNYPMLPDFEHVCLYTGPECMRQALVHLLLSDKVDLTGYGWSLACADDGFAFLCKDGDASAKDVEVEWGPGACAPRRALGRTCSWYVAARAAGRLVTSSLPCSAGDQSALQSCARLASTLASR